MQQHKLNLYYTKDGKLDMIGYKLDGIQHFTADVRYNCDIESYFVLSNKTIEDKYFNEDSLKQSVNIGYYTLVEHTTAMVTIHRDTTYIYCYIQPELFKNKFG